MIELLYSVLCLAVDEAEERGEPGRQRFVFGTYHTGLQTYEYLTKKTAKKIIDFYTRSTPSSS
jgi:hypothetical protein